MNDLITNVQDAHLKLFAQDAMLKGYNWEKWDSDNEVDLPRGYMNITADGELDYGTMLMVRPEIVLIGRPKGPRFSGAMFKLQQIVMAANFHTLLNAGAEGVQFVQRAEKFSFRQLIDGQVRARTISYAIAAAIVE